jgi:hypothetical protein
MFELLRAFGLHPLEWNELRAATRKPSPYIGEILDAAFAISQACVVLMTPDEEVRLRDEFVEDDLERIVSHQPRPNVLLEAGMALDKYRERTVIVELGRMRQVSDLGGIHALRMNDSEERRKELADRLRDADCDVRVEGNAWKTAGNFSQATGTGPPTTRLPSIDTDAEREPILGEVARRLEAQLEDANDLIGDALAAGRYRCRRAVGAGAVLLRRSRRARPACAFGRTGACSSLALPRGCGRLPPEHGMRAGASAFLDRLATGRATAMRREDASPAEGSRARIRLGPRRGRSEKRGSCGEQAGR